MANESKTDFSGSRVDDSGPETIAIVNVVLNAPFMLISIIGNTLVLAAILRTHSLRSPSIILLCSLAASDLLVGLIVQPVYVAHQITDNGSLHKAGNTLAYFASGASLTTMTAISVDRFLALHYHMRYPNLMTTQRAMYTSATLWFITFILSFLTFWNINAYYFVIAISIAICLLISTFCYIRIYRIVRRHQLEIQAQQHVVEINAVNALNLKRSTKSAKTTFIYYIVMMLCYSPTFIVVSASLSWSHVWKLAETVAFMNSSINPFLYCWRLRDLRTAIVKTARKIVCKQIQEN
ncbi:melanocyte-stimulating hormone receptor-like [Oculina patagonica]